MTGASSFIYLAVSLLFVKIYVVDNATFNDKPVFFRRCLKNGVGIKTVSLDFKHVALLGIVPRVFTLKELAALIPGALAILFELDFVHTVSACILAGQSVAASCKSYAG